MIGILATLRRLPGALWAGLVGIIAIAGGIVGIYSKGARDARKDEDLRNAQQRIHVRRRVEASRGADDPDLARKRLHERGGE